MTPTPRGSSTIFKGTSALEVVPLVPGMTNGLNVPGTTNAEPPIAIKTTPAVIRHIALELGFSQERERWYEVRLGYG